MVSRTRSTRILAVVLTIAFTAQEAAFASAFESPSAAAPVSVTRPVLSADNPSALTVPFEFVTLKEIHPGTNGRLIIHLQDAHANLSGQENAAGALEWLMKAYGISLAFVEGGDRDVTLDDIRKMAPAEGWKIAAKRLLYEGIISGHEYLSLVSDHPFRLIGVEYSNLYMQNLDAYAALVGRRKEALQYIHKIRTSITRLKNKLYPQDLIDYEAKRDASHKVLLELAKKAAIDLAKDFPETARLAALQTQENTVDFRKAGADQEELIRQISIKGGPEAVRPLIAASKTAGDSQVSHLAVLNLLFDAAGTTGVDAAPFKDLARYREYLAGFATLDFARVIDEMEEVETRVYAARLETDAARKLRAVDRFVTLLDKGYKIQMSSREFDALIANKGFFSDPAWQAFLNEELGRLGYAEDFVPYETVLEEGQAALERFYDLVNRRDFVFIENIDRIMGEKNQKTAFLVTGGYHTQHLTELMREAGYGYVVLSPIVTAETDRAKYEELLLAPLEEARRKQAADNVTAAASALTESPSGARATLDLPRLLSPEGIVAFRRFLRNNPRFRTMLQSVGLGGPQLAAALAASSGSRQANPAPAAGARTPLKEVFGAGEADEILEQARERADVGENLPNVIAALNRIRQVQSGDPNWAATQDAAEVSQMLASAQDTLRKSIPLLVVEAGKAIDRNDPDTARTYVGRIELADPANSNLGGLKGRLAAGTRTPAQVRRDDARRSLQQAFVYIDGGKAEAYDGLAGRVQAQTSLRGKFETLLSALKTYNRNNITSSLVDYLEAELLEAEVNMERFVLDGLRRDIGRVRELRDAPEAVLADYRLLNPDLLAKAVDNFAAAVEAEGTKSTAAAQQAADAKAQALRAQAPARRSKARRDLQQVFIYMDGGKAEAYAGLAGRVQAQTSPQDKLETLLSALNTYRQGVIKSSLVDYLEAELLEAGVEIESTILNGLKRDVGNTSDFRRPLDIIVTDYRVNPDLLAKAVDNFAAAVQAIAPTGSRPGDELPEFDAASFSRALQDAAQRYGEEFEPINQGSIELSPEARAAINEQYQSVVSQFLKGESREIFRLALRDMPPEVSRPIRSWFNGVFRAIGRYLIRFGLWLAGPAESVPADIPKIELELFTTRVLFDPPSFLESLKKERQERFREQMAEFKEILKWILLNEKTIDWLGTVVAAEALKRGVQPDQIRAQSYNFTKELADQAIDQMESSRRDLVFIKGGSLVPFGFNWLRSEMFNPAVRQELIRFLKADRELTPRIISAASKVKFQSTGTMGTRVVVVVGRRQLEQELTTQAGYLLGWVRNRGGPSVPVGIRDSSLKQISAVQILPNDLFRGVNAVTREIQSVFNLTPEQLASAEFQVQTEVGRVAVTLLTQFDLAAAGSRTVAPLSEIKTALNPYLYPDLSGLSQEQEREALIRQAYITALLVPVVQLAGTSGQVDRAFFNVAVQGTREKFFRERLESFKPGPMTDINKAMFESALRRIISPQFLIKLESDVYGAGARLPPRLALNQLLRDANGQVRQNRAIAIAAALESVNEGSEWQDVIAALQTVRNELPDDAGYDRAITETIKSYAVAAAQSQRAPIPVGFADATYLSGLENEASSWGVSQKIIMSAAVQRFVDDARQVISPLLESRAKERAKLAERRERIAGRVQGIRNQADLEANRGLIAAMAEMKRTSSMSEFTGNMDAWAGEIAAFNSTPDAALGMLYERMGGTPSLRRALLRYLAAQLMDRLLQMTASAERRILEAADEAGLRDALQKTGAPQPAIDAAIMDYLADIALALNARRAIDKQIQPRSLALMHAMRIRDRDRTEPVAAPPAIAPRPDVVYITPRSVGSDPFKFQIAGTRTPGGPTQDILSRVGELKLPTALISLRNTDPFLGKETLTIRDFPALKLFDVNSLSAEQQRQAAHGLGGAKAPEYEFFPPTAQISDQRISSAAERLKPITFRLKDYIYGSAGEAINHLEQASEDLKAVLAQLEAQGAPYKEPAGVPSLSYGLRFDLAKSRLMSMAFESDFDVRTRGYLDVRNDLEELAGELFAGLFSHVDDVEWFSVEWAMDTRASVFESLEKLNGSIADAIEVLEPAAAAGARVEIEPRTDYGKYIRIYLEELLVGQLETETLQNTRIMLDTMAVMRASLEASDDEAKQILRTVVATDTYLEIAEYVEDHLDDFVFDETEVFRMREILAALPDDMFERFIPMVEGLAQTHAEAMNAGYAPRAAGARTQDDLIADTQLKMLLELGLIRRGSKVEIEYVDSTGVLQTAAGTVIDDITEYADGIEDGYQLTLNDGRMYGTREDNVNRVRNLQVEGVPAAVDELTAAFRYLVSQGLVRRGAEVTILYTDATGENTVTGGVFNDPSEFLDSDEGFAVDLTNGMMFGTFADSANQIVSLMPAGRVRIEYLGPQGLASAEGLVTDVLPDGKGGVLVELDRTYRYASDPNSARPIQSITASGSRNEDSFFQEPLPFASFRRTISLTADRGLITVVLGDPERLRQILQAPLGPRYALPAGDVAAYFSVQGSNIMMSGLEGDPVIVASASELKAQPAVFQVPTSRPVTLPAAAGVRVGLPALSDPMSGEGMASLITAVLTIVDRSGLDRSKPVAHEINLDRLMANIPADLRTGFASALNAGLDRYRQLQSDAFVFVSASGELYGLASDAVPPDAKVMALDDVKTADLSALGARNAGGIFFDLQDDNVFNVLAAVGFNGLVGRTDFSKTDSVLGSRLEQFLRRLTGDSNLKVSWNDLRALQNINPEGKPIYQKLAIRGIQAALNLYIQAIRLAVESTKWTA